MFDMNVLNFFNKEIITSERVNNENIDLKKFMSLPEINMKDNIEQMEMII